MQRKRTRRHPSAGPRPTHSEELEARDTMTRLGQAVEDGERPDVAAAAEGWRRAARLAGRLGRRAHAIAEALDHDAREGMGA